MVTAAADLHAGRYLTMPAAPADHTTSSSLYPTPTCRPSVRCDDMLALNSQVGNTVFLPSGWAKM